MGKGMLGSTVVVPGGCGLFTAKPTPNNTAPTMPPIPISTIFSIGFIPPTTAVFFALPSGNLLQAAAFVTVILQNLFTNGFDVFDLFLVEFAAGSPAPCR
jgi:hypothetical protein